MLSCQAYQRHLRISMDTRILITSRRISLRNWWSLHNSASSFFVKIAYFTSRIDCFIGDRCTSIIKFIMNMLIRLAALLHIHILWTTYLVVFSHLSLDTWFLGREYTIRHLCYGAFGVWWRLLMFTVDIISLGACSECFHSVQMLTFTVSIIQRILEIMHLHLLIWILCLEQVKITLTIKLWKMKRRLRKNR